MNIRTLAGATLLAAALVPAHAQDAVKGAKPAAAPIATVNGVAIPATRADALTRARTQQGAPDSPQLRGAVREELINREVITQDANRAGLTRNAEYLLQMDLVRQEVLLQAYVRDFFRKHPVGEAEVQKEYERVKSTMGDKEYKARHILLEQEEQAKSAIADLKKGVKFEELAQKLSKDEGTKSRGGDLDWQSPATLVKPFSDVMVRLEKGKHTEAPVRTQFGWHVIQLEDVRAIKHPSMAEVKPQIEERLRQQRFELHVRDLRSKAKVE